MTAEPSTNQPNNLNKSLPSALQRKGQVNAKKVADFCILQILPDTYRHNGHKLGSLVHLFWLASPFERNCAPNCPCLPRSFGATPMCPNGTLNAPSVPWKLNTTLAVLPLSALGFLKLHGIRKAWGSQIYGPSRRSVG